MSGLDRPIRDRRRSNGLWQKLWQGCCGRLHAIANCLKTAHYAGELVVPEPLDAGG